MLFIKTSMSSFWLVRFRALDSPTSSGLKGWDDPGRHFFGIFWGCLTYIYPIELKNPLGSTLGGHEHVLFIRLYVKVPKGTRVPQVFTRFGLVPF